MSRNPSKEGLLPLKRQYHLNGMTGNVDSIVMGGGGFHSEGLRFPVETHHYVKGLFSRGNGHRHEYQNDDGGAEAPYEEHDLVKNIIWLALPQVLFNVGCQHMGESPGSSIKLRQVIVHPTDLKQQRSLHQMLIVTARFRQDPPGQARI